MYADCSKWAYTERMVPKPQAATLHDRLAAYKQLLDNAINSYCDDLLHASEADFTPYSRDVIATYFDILRRGGKRMRGGLVMNAYEMLGGTDQQVSLKAAQAIEMIHAYLLIVDDICDRSLMRRGGPSAHVLLTEQHRASQLRGGSEHFGVSQALNAALFGSHLAQMELTKLAVPDSYKLEVLYDLNQALTVTLHGQINDIFNEAIQHVSEQDVEHALLWKTAQYSFEAPLQMGVTLAQGNDPVATDIIHEYSNHMGLAFQIADDILGTFGNSFESGKSAMDDIKEGKVTLLISRALERATVSQREQLLQGLGNQKLTPDELDACRQIIEDTGALDYARQRASNHAAQAAEVLTKAPGSWSRDGVAFLRELAGFVTDRKA